MNSLSSCIQCRSRANSLDRRLIEDKSKSPDDASKEQVPERVTYSWVRVETEIEGLFRVLLIKLFKHILLTDIRDRK